MKLAKNLPPKLKPKKDQVLAMKGRPTRRDGSSFFQSRIPYAGTARPKR